ncbi:MAG TPA: carboxymuconolactone decarboxylase, partial [Cupriavidus sp.]|nr:carboxymuconolactone decarboxylase [Cupriavidus sp.]
MNWYVSWTYGIRSFCARRHSGAHGRYSPSSSQ